MHNVSNRMVISLCQKYTVGWMMNRDDDKPDPIRVFPLFYYQNTFKGGVVHRSEALLEI